jgi:hypothetical protein
MLQKVRKKIKEKRRKESLLEDEPLVNLNGLFTIMLVMRAPRGAAPWNERDFLYIFESYHPSPETSPQIGKTLPNCSTSFFDYIQILKALRKFECPQKIESSKKLKILKYRKTTFF